MKRFPVGISFTFEFIRLGLYSLSKYRQKKIIILNCTILLKGIHLILEIITNKMLISVVVLRHLRLKLFNFITPPLLAEMGIQ